MQPMPEDWDRAVAVVAHPDDLEYGVASAVARWNRQGKHVSYLLATRGSEAGATQGGHRIDVRYRVLSPEIRLQDRPADLPYEAVEQIGGQQILSRSRQVTNRVSRH